MRVPRKVPDSFERDGFAVIPELIGGDAVSLLIEDFESLRTNEGDHSLRNVHQSTHVRTAASSESVAGLAVEILGARARLVRAIYFDKIPAANWSVPWHQDLTIAVASREGVEGFGPWSCKQGVWHVQPPAEILERMVTIRLHLDRCGPDNGPVRVKPGSHLHGRIPETSIGDWPSQDVACVGELGSALVMRPLLLHASSPAIVARHRRVLHLEFAGCELPPPLEWYLGLVSPG